MEPVGEIVVCDFVSGLRVSDIPEAVRTRAKWLILDQIGVQLATCGLPWVTRLKDYVRRTAAAGPCTILGSNDRFGPEAAALLNGTAGHGFEADDYVTIAPAHPGCAVIPAVLAVGEARAAAGADVLAAYVAGVEFTVRVARSATPQMLYDRGFHQTGAFGVFGSAIATGLLLNLTPERLVHAVAIAASHAGGTTEFTASGGDVKRLHGGNGASFGVRSGLLADAGFAGPLAAVTGRRGFLHAFSPTPEPRWLLDDLGNSWQLSYVMTKPYACNARLIPQIDALGTLLDEYALHASNVERIRVGIDQAAVSHGLADPAAALQSVSAMQMSTPVAMGLRVVRGANDFHAYYELALGDKTGAARIAEIADRVETYVDDDCNAARPARRIAKVTVETADGRTLRTEAASPTPADLREQDVFEKFHRLTADRFGPTTRACITDIVSNIEDLDDIRSLTTLLREPSDSG